MSVFEDVHLEWGGKRYTIPAKRMMGAIATIERHLTLKEMHEAGTVRGTLPLAAISMAYASVLRYAGADVEDEQVYGGLFGDGDKVASVNVAIQALMAMMIPPSAMQKTNGAQSAPGNGNRRQRRAAAAKSSQKPTN